MIEIVRQIYERKIYCAKLDMPDSLVPHDRWLCGGRNVSTVCVVEGKTSMCASSFSLTGTVQS